MSSPAELRKLLAQRKSVLSRHINSLAKAVDAGCASHVESRISKLESTIADIEGLHDKLIVSLEGDDLKTQTEWFSAAESEFYGSVKNAKTWLKQVKSDESHVEKKPVASNDDACTSMKALAQIVSLPKIELEPFSGDPIKFHSFMNAFKVNVENVCQDPDARLAHLIASTRGIARDAISGCHIVGGEAGYKKAMATLKESFGEDQAIISSIVNELLSEKSVHSAEEVMKFSHKLNNARAILVELEAEDEIDSQILLQRIVQCLPQSIQNKWRDKQLASKRKNKIYLDFEELVKFVKQISDEMNDPLYGQSKTTNPKKSAAKVQEKVFASVSGKDKRNEKPSACKLSCKLCNGDHSLSRCAKFKDMSVHQRADFVNRHKMCTNCLRCDHVLVDCASDNRCFVCKGKHSVFLHVDRAIVNSTTHRQVDVAFMPIVKVKVNDRHWVHAALDSCSSATFCSKALARDLSLHANDCSFTLDTLSGESQVSSHFVSMKLSNGTEAMTISGVKLVDRIPVTSGRIDLSLYPHLQGIDVSAGVDCKEVQLLDPFHFIVDPNNGH